MTETYFTEQDIIQIRNRGMTPETVASQIRAFERGFPKMTLIRPCTPGDGIRKFLPEDMQRLDDRFSRATLDGRVMKFVPASGAASRMFKSLLSVLNRASLPDLTKDPEKGNAKDAEYDDFRTFIQEIRSFAFFGDLKSTLSKDGYDLETLLLEGGYRTILEYALTPAGLNLSGIPKGLIKFHDYTGHSRTPIEEHLVEAVTYTRDGEGVARIHFTVSPEHETEVRKHIDKVRTLYEKAETRLDISISLQLPSTDTIAVDMDNRPFRDSAGRLVFRPGGHGVLLDNIRQLQGDIIFVKNIDNVVPDTHKEDTILYKRALGGILLELQDTLFDYVGRLLSGAVKGHAWEDILEFARNHLTVIPPADFDQLTTGERTRFLLEKLQRPLRVCGMVKNEEEPGGGPFWVENRDGSPSLQIVESSQVDMTSRAQRAAWEASTHFNPVDLVCGLRDHLGRPFDLPQYSDPDTGFISTKSLEGKELKALELPGLWNGAMARWNTVFVEVPISTFNPVKTVFDLLRKEHGRK